MRYKAKLAALTLLGLSLTAGTAFAGNGKNCHKNKQTTAQSTAVTTTAPTAVLSTTSTAKAAMKGERKIYSFDEALKLCQAKGAADLQACVDYKTGKTMPQG